MREIKFRAIATDGVETSTDGVEIGDFVYGYYYFCRMRMSGIIITELGIESGGIGSGLVQVEIEVDCKTVGQYTGLKDKKGKEIYEGDILKWTARDNDYSIMEQIDVVSFKNGSFITIDKEYKHAVSFYEDGCKRQITKQSIVIGNIYENKDLLK